MVAYTQDGRIAAIETELGKDVLLLTSLRGAEAISVPFAFEAEVVSARTDLDPETMVGMKVLIRIGHDLEARRLLHGIVESFSIGDAATAGLCNYHLYIVPWLQLLSHSADCRIFQDKTVPDIIRAVFHDHGFEDFTLRLHDSYPKREYCVQYRESTLAFVSRLMEEEGLFYYFEHEEQLHRLVISDANIAFKKLASPDINCFPGMDRKENAVWGWRQDYSMRTGKRTLRDFNFEAPGTELETEEATALSGIKPAQKAEIYDYPGQFMDLSRGKALVTLTMEAEETGFHRVAGHSALPSLVPGFRLKVASHPMQSEIGKEYVLRRVNHSVTVGSYASGGGEDSYDNEFECFSASVAFRAPRKTPRPIVYGPQTAIVVGPAGEEIFTDKYGRIKLQFHWDRLGKKDDKSSCWVRVSQSWAGKGYGFIQIPRIGQEVVVDFIEGDPDRPLVTGRVYNADQMPPHGLPAGMVKSGFKSNSTKGGGGSNELTLDDTKGKEQIYLHAQYDLDGVIEHNETRHVKNNRDTTIDANETQMVGGNETQTVQKNQTITIVGNRTETVNESETVTVAKLRTTLIGINDALTVGAAREHSVGAAETVTVGASRSVNVGSSQSVSVGRDQSVSVGGNQTTSVAKDETHKVGKKLTIEAGDQIVLKTGSATITMKKNGDIIIQGKQITIKGSGDVVIKGQKILEN
ncbi:type VI secretion system Vgr family protein [Falsiroseomonas sp. HW251]|uniref:type VI secretion system Vgr family protein n=1 Tax=Falsiroseomonas sp. HW251 TaxID=3390998 RepID=UPI003D310C16